MPEIVNLNIEELREALGRTAARLQKATAANRSDLQRDVAILNRVILLAEKTGPDADGVCRIWASSVTPSELAHVARVVADGQKE